MSLLRVPVILKSDPSLRVQKCIGSIIFVGDMKKMCLHSRRFQTKVSARDLHQSSAGGEKCMAVCSEKRPINDLCGRY